MLISDKQHAANIANAQKSTGPTTPEGKETVRMNPLSHGLRSRYLVIRGEKAAEYNTLWLGLIKEWQPATVTECHLVEQMAHAQWFLVRANMRENSMDMDRRPFEEQMVLADRFAAYRARQDRSFTQAVTQLQKLRVQRILLAKLEAQQPAAEQTSEQSASEAPAATQTDAPPPKPQPITMPMPSYIMSDSPAPAPPMQCASETDTR